MRVRRRGDEMTPRRSTCRSPTATSSSWAGAGDELLVRVGPYRRAIVLPDTLRRRPVTAARLRDGCLTVGFGVAGGADIVADADPDPDADRVADGARPGGRGAVVVRRPTEEPTMAASSPDAEAAPSTRSGPARASSTCRPRPAS